MGRRMHRKNLGRRERFGGCRCLRHGTLSQFGSSYGELGTGLTSLPTDMAFHVSAVGLAFLLHLSGVTRREFIASQRSGEKSCCTW